MFGSAFKAQQFSGNWPNNVTSLNFKRALCLPAQKIELVGGHTNSLVISLYGSLIVQNLNKKYLEIWMISLDSYQI